MFRVASRMLPPSIMAIPTSEMARANPARTATSEREPGLAEDDPAGLAPAGAEGQGGQAGPPVDLPEGRVGEADDERQDEEDLADGHGRLGVEEAEPAEGPVPAEERIEEEADDDRRARPSRSG